ncbi:hypothetical protein H310_05746 [Aphanomyces invadans]|uniref:DDE Tnp4 domain-containing protein n=1 Tax=Aphanomyces invadans TaxID=157072 RepID=A0A024U973_9STRA|nr:hypothetical protein H310_05746 [Aphanomyces invadans]ETW02178.1 hypothetical protein H310_05746 [Aphanomyces invadans]|eukprot:XP_008868783.1 hypothetical protein H310_05746 [Aphanomyces invadans]
MKHYGSWDVVAAVFPQKSRTIQKRVISFVKVLHFYLLQNYTEKKTYYSENHALNSHEVEVSVLPNGLAIISTKYFKGSLSDMATFDQNIDFYFGTLAKHPNEDNLADPN